MSDYNALIIAMSPPGPAGADGAGGSIQKEHAEITVGSVGAVSTTADSTATVTSAATGVYDFVFSSPFPDDTYTASYCGADGQNADYIESNRTASGITITTANTATSAGTGLIRKFRAMFRE